VSPSPASVSLRGVQRRSNLGVVVDCAEHIDRRAFFVPGPAEWLAMTASEIGGENQAVGRVLYQSTVAVNWDWKSLPGAQARDSLILADSIA